MIRFLKKFSKKHIAFIYIVAAVAIIYAAIFLYTSFFGAPQANAEPERFVVNLNIDTSGVISQLKAEGFIRSELIFKLIFWLKGGTLGNVPAYTPRAKDKSVFV